jgi:folate-dependent phosphoribosylglycinamide formyltransferase PurN
MSAQPKIVAITAGGPYPWIILNAIGERFGPLAVIEEEPESKAYFLKRRARKLGWISTVGQFATMVLSRFGKRFAGKREAELVDEFGLRVEPDPEHRCFHVKSANDAECLDIMAREMPDVVFLAGCRMLTPRTLAAIDAPVLNYHAGINPKYRGMMGGYWALVEGDAENFGTTVHLVDAGVDTGDILYQARMTPARNDSMLTYALVMAAHSRDICIRAVDDVLSGKQSPVRVGLPSRQRFHPTLWAYVWYGLTRGIW